MISTILGNPLMSACTEATTKEILKGNMREIVGKDEERSGVEAVLKKD
jgi:hypothetical protein